MSKEKWSNILSNKVIERAKKLCIEQKERITKPRIEVLKIIAQSHKPIGAYAILDKLGLVIEQPKPQTVYRAIDFWRKLGLIHNIESLNAYTLCQLGYKHEGSQFMLCDSCGKAIETPVNDIPKALRNNMINESFTPSEWTMEIHGSCSSCQA